MATTARQTSAPLLGEPLAVELMNTIWADRGGLHDALAEPADVAAWLAAIQDRLPSHNSSDARVPADDPPSDIREVARELRELRDALRRLAAETTSDSRAAAASSVADRERAVARLNRACAYAPTWSGLAWPDGEEPRRTVRSARGPGETALSVIAEQAVTLFTGLQRDEIRACYGPGCVLYFIRDHPRRSWCSGICGNRARVARHYQRHRDAGAG